MNRNITALVSIAGFFTFLKLIEAITWSWWWVLAPLWVPPLALVASVAGFVLFALLGISALILLGADVTRGEA